MRTLLQGGLAAVALLGLALASGCSAGSFDAGEQQLRDDWAELVTAHRQRAELAPALVYAVRGQPGIDDAALAAVTQARARVAAMTVPTRQLPGPEALREFQRSHDALGQAIARLLAMSESHPGLITEPRYLDVRRRLEANDRRLAAARTRYVQAVQDFNARLEGLPLRLAAGALGLEAQPTLAPEGSVVVLQAAPAAAATR